MSIRTAACMVLVLASLASGAAGALTSPRDAQSAAVPVDPPLDPVDARARWRWIGIRAVSTAPCPAAPQGWTVAPLFALEGPSVPPGLRPFCLYEAPEGTPVGIAPIAFLKAHIVSGALLDVSMDAMAAGGLGSALARRSLALLEQHFVAQAGQPIDPFVGAQSTVRLALIDTAPSDESAPWDFVNGRSPHGYTLANFARALLCDGPAANDCLARITTQLALAYRCFDSKQRLANCPMPLGGPARDPARGGWMGLIGELATAIQQEVIAWNGNGRLVLNLSVGWDGARFGGVEQDISDMPVPVQAVYRALQYASCRGALVVAAAGNKLGGPDDESGPMYPAGWEQRVAPGQNACAGALGAPPPPIFPPFGERDHRSLLYAAGGVRENGGGVFNARVAGEPRLTAFADHAVVELPVAPAGTPSATLSGSSVAALVVSSAAAAVWYYAPARRPYEAIEAVYDAAAPLGRGAAFCRGGTEKIPCPGTPPEVRQASVCASAVAVCAGGACAPPLPSCPPTGALDLSTVNVADFLPADVDLGDLVDDFEQDLGEAPVCDAQSISYDAGAGTPDNPCPAKQFYGETALPWLGPQPPCTPCPNCMMTRALPSDPYTLYLEIDDERNWALEDATLQCGDRLYALQLGTLSDTDKRAVENIECDEGEAVSISFTTADGDSTQDALLSVE